tara:strand:- start:417 stop:662 length:246 start_codon:yes stop_codon:yes gene_type:complete
VVPGRVAGQAVAVALGTVQARPLEQPLAGKVTAVALARVGIPVMLAEEQPPKLILAVAVAVLEPLVAIITGPATSTAEMVV